MLEKIKAIRKALQDENPYVALALALTLPDICGQIEYPWKKVGERYKDWFDNNVLPQYYKVNNELEFPFDGKVCYQLRCSYLHSGNSDVEKYIDTFELAYNKDTVAKFFNSYSIEKDKTTRMTLDVNGLCYFLCLAAERYYETTTQKEIFGQYSICITCNDDKDFNCLFNSAII